MKTREEISYLFTHYLQGTCSSAEKQAFFRVLADPAYDALLNEIREQDTGWPETVMLLDESTTESVWQAIQKGTRTTTPVIKKKLHWLYWPAAACIVLLSMAAWIWLGRSQKPVNGANTPVAAVLPGSYGALLTLEDGNTVQLDSLQSGLVSTVSGAQALLQKGLLTYDMKLQRPDSAGSLPGGDGHVNYHKIVTPRGNHFQLVLSDGTKVWLNAASSIRYPALFAGKERTVEITGEAYFEVAGDAQRPFVVNVPGKIQVEVLGTHFNVNAYADEPVTRTTLLEGKVKITNGAGGDKKSVILQPAQECVLQDNHLQVVTADMETAVGWTKGLFYFKSADLVTVMKSISRWYDVEIQIDAGIESRFTGSMYRKKDIGELLTAISFVSNVECRLNNKTVIVSPK